MLAGEAVSTGLRTLRQNTGQLELEVEKLEVYLGIEEATYMERRTQSHLFSSSQ